jgi:AcrR family transcriptional regulator
MSVPVIRVGYPPAIARWEPDARGRLEQAALDLYLERGFERTTVAEIAQRAGLTERTFYRHFADKREVLFGGSAILQEMLVSAVVAAPPGASPMDAIAAALDAASTLLDERRDTARQRQKVINANDELRERELIKMASLGDAMAAALRRRGVKDPVAALSAESGIAVFRVAFDRWVSAKGRRRLSHYVHESLDQLKAVTSGM